MLKDFAWNYFECTGSIEGYMFYKEIPENEKGREEENKTEQEVATSKM